MSGRVMMITGGTGRLARHYAVVLSEVGANVVLIDLDQSVCDKVAGELRDEFDTDPLSLQMDVSDKSEVMADFKEVVDHYGRIDVLINNAAAHQFTIVDGVIMNIGSVYGVVACDQRIYGDSGQNSNVAYATTKSGVFNLTRYTASFWQGKNIRVNCLSPGGVFANQAEEFVENYTYRTMLKRMAESDDLASAVAVFGVGRIQVGDRCQPHGGWWLDRLVARRRREKPW
jgi:NAD(P)-dependent dehydrogenase (short-subunit alcohol dehydrogenase family)